MEFRRPDALLAADEGPAVGLLRTYYGPDFGAPGFYTGSAFDTWDSTGTRARDVDRFTADDLVAVSFLSVVVEARAAHALLHQRAEEFADLLSAVGPDRDLADEVDVLDDGWAGWRLLRALRELPGIGPTTATKLFARKRPRLRPIWDPVVADVTSTRRAQWEPLRVALRENDKALHRQLLRVRDSAGVPEEISALRVLDVIAWLQGKHRH